MNEEGAEIKALSWISTHPESNERAADIMRKLEHRNLPHSMVIKPITWEKVQEAVKSE